MKTTKKTKWAYLGALALLLSVTPLAEPVHATGIITEQKSNYSTLAPVLNVTLSTTTWTNNNINLNVSVSTPSGSPMSYVVQPNGVVTTATSFQYVLTTNGLYTFKVFDQNGRVGFYSVHVKSIDRKKPTIIFSPPVNWMNKDQVMDIGIVND